MSDSMAKTSLANKRGLIGHVVSPQWAMRRAVDLGLRSLGRTAPNPSVGCVIVAADGRLIGWGRHHHCGGPHAEVLALRHVETNFGSDAAQMLRGGSAYVTLAPCTTHGRTPPCSEALHRAGLGSVIAGLADFNQDDAAPFFAKVGIHYEVASPGSWFGAACSELHGGFSLRIHQGRPRFTLKWAQTSDGFIARSGGGGDISCPVARQASRRHRRRFDAILIGAKTIRIDDPTLRAIPAELSPQTIIVTRSGHLPSDARILAHDPWVICGPKCDFSPAWQACRILRLDELQPQSIAQCLGRLGLNDVLVEGGADLQRQFFQADLVDLLHVETREEQWHSGLPAPEDARTIDASFEPLASYQFGQTTIQRWQRMLPEIDPESSSDFSHDMDAGGSD